MQYPDRDTRTVERVFLLVLGRLPSTDEVATYRRQLRTDKPVRDMIRELTHIAEFKQQVTRHGQPYTDRRAINELINNAYNESVGLTVKTYWRIYGTWVLTLEKLAWELYNAPGARRFLDRKAVDLKQRAAA